ncbi:MAG: 2Fe-2S iron-sulfur cluster binding domain-containing protein [Deltaproteobacteria bacterium]|nr:2Fe-2S iron-sulfur cluster binding domain-containing protein [Deltaproteobacteria bacterium]MBW2676871.1 2Fe-2S iron-sulfur cluster binding domain-containing protein [Deltaproteobacteria bacterium]
MKKGIWQEFDGYEEIAEEIEFSFKAGKERSFDRLMAGQYIRQLHPRQLKLRIVDVIAETASTKTLRLAPVDALLPPFLAGQYIPLFLEINGIRTSRPYSISSQPRQTGYYDITVRRVPDGLVSNYLMDRIKTGDQLDSAGPQGNFHYNPLYHDKHMVCIAGGSGITPFMSMIREIVECGLDRTVTLLYGNRQPDDIIFHEELERISARFDNITYIPVIEKPGKTYTGACGFINAALIREILGSMSDMTFFLCGPQGMYEFCLPELESLGIEKRKIRKEMYGPPDNICDHQGWPSQIEAEDRFEVKILDGRTISVRARDPLLVSLENEGILPPSICRSGECSMCRVKVLSGKVFQPAGTPVRKSDTQFGYVHSCISYPLGDLEIML